MGLPHRCRSRVVQILPHKHKRIPDSSHITLFFYHMLMNRRTGHDCTQRRELRTFKRLPNIRQRCCGGARKCVCVCVRACVRACVCVRVWLVGRAVPKRTFADKSTGHAAHSDVPLSIYPASLEVATQVSFLPTPPGTPSDDEEGSRAPSPAPQPAGVDKAQRTQRKRSPSPKKKPKPKKPAAFRPSKVTEADVRIPSSWQK